MQVSKSQSAVTYTKLLLLLDMKKLSKEKNAKINETIGYTIGFIILAMTLYFISTIDFRLKTIPCIKNSTVTVKQFLYKGELYFKIPKKFGITNLYCKY